MSIAPILTIDRRQGLWERGRGAVIAAVIQPQGFAHMVTTKKLVSLTVLAAFTTAALSLGACNTLEGVGKDVQKAGEKIEGVAKDDKKKK
jgi:predicted small secreted protein